MNFDLSQMLLRIPALLVAITVHEYAHARVAYSFGDPTAKMQGRMSLNPLVHLDPIGTLMMLIAGIGWARPVPVNPYRFRNYRTGMLSVAAAGPLSNFAAAFIALILLTISGSTYGSIGYGLLQWLVLLNIMLGVFNLIPLPPLDGSKVLASLAPDSVLSFYRQIEPLAPFILLALIIFNILPRIIWPLADLLLDGMVFVISFFV